MDTPTKPIPTALPGGIDGTEPKESTPAVRGESRIIERCECLEDQIVQLMAIMCYCARGDADIEALNAAIRWGLKKHRNLSGNLIRRRLKAQKEAAQ